MHRLLLTLLLVCFSKAFCADDALLVQSDQAFYRKDGLFLWVALADSPESFLAEWNHPSNPQAPEIRRRTTFHRGEIVFPALMFATDGLTPEGDAMITYSLLFKKPDGSVYEDMQNLVAVLGPPTKGLGLAKAMAGIKLEDTDPLGPYSLTVKITDQVKNVSVEMPFVFLVADESSKQNPPLDSDGGEKQAEQRIRPKGVAPSALPGSPSAQEAPGKGGGRSLRIRSSEP